MTQPEASRAHGPRLQFAASTPRGSRGAVTALGALLARSNPLAGVALTCGNRWRKGWVIPCFSLPGRRTRGWCPR